MCTSAPACGARPCSCAVQCRRGQHQRTAASEQQKRTPGADRRAAIVVDDDSVVSADLGSGDDYLQIEEQWRPCWVARRKRSMPLSYPSMAERIIHEPAELLSQLSVVELPTSGFHNNCLWFSVQRATRKLGATEQYSAHAECSSDCGRAQIHEELLRALPAAADQAEGRDDVWWAGFSRARAETRGICAEEPGTRTTGWSRYATCCTWHP